MIRAAAALIAAAMMAAGCLAPQPSVQLASPAPQVSSATPTATPSPTPTEPPTPEPTLPPISEAAAYLPDGSTIVSQDDHSEPNGRIMILRTVAADTYLDGVIACDGRGRIEVTLEDATAGIPEDTRTLIGMETACSAVPEQMTVPGPRRDAPIGIVVRAPEGARYWVVIAAPAEDVRP